MKRLNQVLAVESAIKKKREDEFTRIYQDVQKPDLSAGFTKTYNAKDENGEKFPQETKRVQVRAQDALVTAKNALQELFDITATKDATNTGAKADVVIDGTVVLSNVPATHLLFIEKRMASVIEFIKKLPVLAADESWEKDPALGLYRTQPVQTLKTKKTVDFKVVVPPTPQHPAQVKEVTEDVVVGSWSTVKYSGALPADEVKALLNRAEKVQRAVKSARQAANEVEAREFSTSPLLAYIFGA